MSMFARNERKTSPSTPATLKMVPRKSLYRWLITLTLLVAAILAVSTSTALATDGLPPGEAVPTWAATKFAHFMPPKPEGASPQFAGNHGEKLEYWGGPVQTAPELYLLFWGGNFWNNTEPSSLYEELHLFYESLGVELIFPYTKGWQGILTQYTDVQGTYQDAKIVAESHINAIKAPVNLTNAMVEEEAETWIRELKTKGTAPGPNAQFVVLTAPGTTISETAGCGYHSVLSYDGGEYSYTYVPYAGDATKYYEKYKEGITCNYLESNTKVHGINAKMMFSTTGVASHEFAESVTDPLLKDEIAWQGEQKNGEVEIADLCEDEPEPIQELPDKEGRLGWTYVFLLWDDEGGNKCSLEDPPYETPSVPSVNTEAATSLGYHEAKINGSVNPNGPDAHYDFEWGVGSVGEHKTSESNAGYGGSAVHENDTLTGLKAGTTYHFRIVASNWVGTTVGGEDAFTTPIPPPVVTTEKPTELGEKHAVLNALVNPEGFATTYQLEYWEDGKSSEVKTIPTTPESVGSGENNVAVHQHLTGLSKSTEYIYRVTATSAGGTRKGSEISFVTGPFLESQTTPNASGATANVLHGVSCASSVACAAVGDDKNSSGVWVPLGESWNGAEWQLKSTPTPSGGTEVTLSGVSCSSSTACTAVGAYKDSAGEYEPLAERWNGSEWTLQSAPATTGKPYFVSLLGVSCSSATWCVAVGYYWKTGLEATPIIDSWNGTEWKTQSSPNTGKEFTKLEGVSCTSSTACTAVGTTYSAVLIERWNGTEWTLQTGVNKGVTNYLSAVSCTSTTSCTAAGTSEGTGLAESWNGTTWSSQSIPTPSGGKAIILTGISCSSSTSCVAAGHYESSSSVEETLAESWNGTEWRTHATNVPAEAQASGLTAVGCTSASFTCVTVGYDTDSVGTSVTLAELTGQPITRAEKATSVTSSSATLETVVDPAGGETTYHFEYGPTSSYGTSIPVPDGSVGSYISPETVKQSLSKLQPETTYHYRVVATNSNGVSYGKDHTLATTRAWSLVSTPNASGATANVLHGVSCASSVACAAVGDDKNSSGVWVPLGESWNGAEWQLKSTPTPSGGTEVTLSGVSCSSSTACTAVGAYKDSAGEYEPLAERWNGSEWTLQSAPATTGKPYFVSLLGVSCSSATWCVAVGYYWKTGLEATPIIDSWNGTEWKTQSSPNTGKEFTKLEGVSCTSSTACTAVGTTYSAVLIERWNGTEWTLQTGVNKGVTNYLSAVSCTSTTSCTAAGTSEGTGLAESWNGTTWSSQSIPTPSGGKAIILTGISCSSSTSCVAAGHYESSSSVEETLAESWNGTEWQVHSMSLPTGASGGQLDSVSCVSTTVCTAIGDDESNSGTVVTLAETTGAPIAATEGATAITSHGVTLNGTVIPDGWSTTYHFEYGTTKSYGTKVPVPDASLASEIAGEKVAYSLSGLQPETTCHYRIVATSSEGTTDGEDYTFATTRGMWSTISTPNASGATANVLHGVSCASSVACAAVGDDKNSSGVWVPLGESWNGAEWQLKSTPTPSGGTEVTLSGVSCSSSTACTAVGAYKDSAGEYEPLAERWNGSEWTLQSAPATTGKPYFVSLLGVSCSSATWCVAVGYYWKTGLQATPIIDSWNGTEWKTQSSPNTGKEFTKLEGVSCTSSTACTAVGTTYSAVLIERWNGTEWTLQTGVNKGVTNYLSAVSCTSTTSCTAAGTSEGTGLAESWNGTTWSSQSIPTPSGGKAIILTGISCSSSTSCVAAGHYESSSSVEETLAESWNGTEWQVVSTPNPSGAKSSQATGVSCVSSVECFAAGDFVNSSSVTDTLGEVGP